jgi:glycosyltransferase involved in cell wall biosynthesis
MKSYVLVTPARNEEAYIEKTIRSVISQSVLPRKWAIVSDGSVDRTDEIIGEYSKKCDFILPLHRRAGQERHFGSKAEAFRFGYEQLQDLEFDFIGNLDADVSFDSKYYEGVLSKFEENERLGVAGGIRFDLIDGRFRKVLCARNSVGGPFQLFRRQCYETIGGYRPLRLGGIDAVAETMARMHGWDVESFPDLEVYHYRCTGTAGGGILRANFKAGMRAYVIGYHPLFLMARCAFRLLNYPLLIGSFTQLAGYFWAFLRRHERAVSDDFVEYLRSEQLSRLWSRPFGPRLGRRSTARQ